jgi:hypothetical protein
MWSQFGYASLLFPSAEAFANYSDLDRVVCVVLDIDLGDGSGIELRHRLKKVANNVPVIYMTGNEDPRRSRGCASIRMPRLSHKAVLGEVAEGLAQESRGGARIKRSRRHGSRWLLWVITAGLWDSVLKNNALWSNCEDPEPIAPLIRASASSRLRFGKRSCVMAPRSTVTSATHRSRPKFSAGFLARKDGGPAQS